jgi:hypothetical protein
LGFVAAAGFVARDDADGITPAIADVKPIG